jgi:two-component system KDP operon response regulator KdpE
MKGRILIIDDEPQLLQELTASLGARGYETEVVSRARDALESVARRPPDLVLVDPDLPDSRGVDIIGKLRSQCQAPVLVLSGSATSADKVAALEAGAGDYISKPYDMDELLARIRAASRRAAKASGGDRPGPSRAPQH